MPGANAQRRFYTQADLRGVGESDSQGDERRMLQRSRLCIGSGVQRGIELQRNRDDNRSRDAGLLRFHRRGDRDRLVMNSAAGIRHLPVGRIVTGAACVSRGTHRVHVGHRYGLSLHRQGRGKAYRRTDKECQQANNRDETGERALHAVSVETDQKRNRYTTDTVYQQTYADQ